MKFADLLDDALASAQSTHPEYAAGYCSTSSGKRCDLCYASRINYEDEIAVKNVQLQRFWKHFAPPTALQPLRPSPMGREYRVVSKRKVKMLRGRLVLGLIDATNPRLIDVGACAIEARRHARIYRTIGNVHRQASAAPLLRELRYVVLKGTYDSVSIIFNIADSSPALLKAANNVSRRITRDASDVRGIFLYESAKDGGYYLGNAKSTSAPALRKLFGGRKISMKVGEQRFVYDILAFSQINQSANELLVSTARELCGNGRDHLYDLYCGYGLFSLCLADAFRSVTGVEISSQAVVSARETARRIKHASIRFHCSDITVETLHRFLPVCGENDVVLLDPPRGGMGPGVQESIAGREAPVVLHVFCNMDIIERDLRAWKRLGYDIACAIPVDNFPGTSLIELFVLLRRRSS